VSKLEVGKGGAYVYFETISSMVLGYAFWFIMTKISTSEVIGISSAMISLATIFTSIVTLGIPNGVQRFLGISFAENRIEEAKVYVKSSILLISFGIITTVAIILIAQSWLSDTFKITHNLIIVAILLIASSAINTLFRSVIIATLKTKILPIVMIISSTFKIILSIILVSSGLGVFGLTFGFTMNQILASLLLTISLVMLLRTRKKSETSVNSCSKNIMNASVASWFPALITTIGSQLGIIVVYGAQGANQAGVFFIAFAIFSAITGIMFSLFTIAYPALSAMRDGRKRLTWRIIKMSLIISMPFSGWLIFYSKNVLQLFNQSYVDGYLALGILLSSMLPIAVMTGVNTLVYSYGNYRQVLAIGLFSSMPRAILYFILVPTYGGIGASLSYTIGSIAGFIVSIVIARKIGMQIVTKDLILLLIPIMALSFLLSYLEVNYIIGLLAIPIITWISLLKAGIIAREDLHDSIGILPSNIANPILSLVNAIAKKLNRTY